MRVSWMLGAIVRNAVSGFSFATFANTARFIPRINTSVAIIARIVTALFIILLRQIGFGVVF